MDENLPEVPASQEEYTQISEEELTALLGKDAMEKLIKQPANNSNALQVVTKDEGEFVRERTMGMSDMVQDTIEAVIAQVQTTPDDEKLINGLSSLIKAQATLLETLNKVNLLREKYKHERELQEMKNSSDAKINRENNQTKILLSRDEVFKKIIAAQKKKSKEEPIVDV